jgi:DNA-binding transcriptional LysR family regulator
MELRHLRYFIVLAEELNFRRAAERLEMAQPPLSKQIRDLELELGSKLFERNQKRVLLTKAGKVFLKEVRQIIEHVDLAVTRTQQAHLGGKVKISIGFTNSTHHLLGKVCKALKNIKPEWEISIQEIPAIEQLSAIKNDRIDLALGYLPDLTLIQRGGLAVQALQRENFYLALPANHPQITEIAIQQRQSMQLDQVEQNIVGRVLERKIITAPQFDEIKSSTTNINDQFRKIAEQTNSDQVRLSIEILNNETLILANSQWGDLAEIRMRELLSKLNIKPQHIQEVSTMEVALSLVQQEMGVTIVSSAQQGVPRSGVCYVELIESIAEKEIGLTWRVDNQKTDLGNIAKFYLNL